MSLVSTLLHTLNWSNKLIGGEGWRKSVILENERAEVEKRGNEECCKWEGTEEGRSARNARVRDGKGKIEWTRKYEKTQKILGRQYEGREERIRK